MSATKPLAIAATIATLSATTWVGLGHVAGNRIERELEQQYTDLARLPFVDVKDRRYDRSLGGATAQFTLVIGCPQIDLPGGNGGKAGFEVTLRNRITHGPFAGGELAAARIETDLVLSEEANRRFAALFAGRKPVTAVTRVSFDGALETTLEVPELRLDAAAWSALAGTGAAAAAPAGTGNWGGMTLVSRVSGDRERSDYRGEIRPLHLVEPQGGTFSTSAATFEGKGKRIEGWMYDDDSRFSMASFTIDLPASARDGTDAAGARAPLRLAMKDIGGTSTLRVDGGYLGQKQLLEIGSLAFGERAIGKINYDTSLERIHLATLADAVRSLATTGAGCASFTDGTAERQIGPLLESLKKAAFGLLEHEPRFAVDRMSVTLPEGEARIGYQVVLGKITEADLADPQELMSKIGLKADAVVSEALIGRFLNMVLEESGAGPGLSAEQLDERMRSDPMIRQGYLNRANGRISSSFEMKAGQVKINGKAIDDETAAMAIGMVAMAAGG